MAHPFLPLPPPKTTGREMFGRDFVMPLLRGKGTSTTDDVIARVVKLVAVA